jgi:hypothetical protein
MADSPLPPAALRQAQERTIARLGEHFARDHLEAEELERLIDRVYQATTPAQLEELLQGLPSLATPAAGEALAPPRPLGPVRENQAVVAFMGGAERSGTWSPARHVHVVAIMGGVALDFRDARLADGVTEVNVVAVMGGVEIVVPPSIYVESNGIGIMGGFEHTGRARLPVDQSVPILRITGVAIMGGVEVSERLPGESGKDARRRRRQERREQRRLGGTGHDLDDSELRRLERGMRGEPRDGSNWGGWGER